MSLRGGSISVTIMGTAASRSRVSPGKARAKLVARLTMRQRLRWSPGVSVY